MYHPKYFHTVQNMPYITHHFVAAIYVHIVSVVMLEEMNSIYDCSSVRKSMG